MACLCFSAPQTTGDKPEVQITYKSEEAPTKPPVPKETPASEASLPTRSPLAAATMVLRDRNGLPQVGPAAHPFRVRNGDLVDISGSWSPAENPVKLESKLQNRSSSHATGTIWSLSATSYQRPPGLRVSKRDPQLPRPGQNHRRLDQSLHYYNSQSRPPDIPEVAALSADLAAELEGFNVEDFPLEVLQKATDDFHPLKKLGQGAFGEVFRGVLADGRDIAVKKGEGVQTSVTQFYNEIRVLARLDNPNLVKLLGYCSEAGQLMLVYEYIPKGTLRDYLREVNMPPLEDLKLRVQIAVGAGRGLLYLHQHEPQIVHRDVKSTNILLGEHYQGFLSDFGLALLWPESKADDTHVTTLVRGTLGYLDPEYFVGQQLTDKSDVYSFGVVLLEVLTGQKAVTRRNGNSNHEKSLVTVMRPLMPNRVMEVLDTRLAPLVQDPVARVVIDKLAQTAAECIKLTHRTRPRMARVMTNLVQALNQLQGKAGGDAQDDEGSVGELSHQNLGSGRKSDVTAAGLGVSSSVDGSCIGREVVHKDEVITFTGADPRHSFVIGVP